jgi:hypothetical protein
MTNDVKEKLKHKKKEFEKELKSLDPEDKRRERAYLEIEILALELFELDLVNNSADIKTKGFRIIEKELSFLGKTKNEMATFPLLTHSNIPYPDFWDILLKRLEALCLERKYNPEKSLFRHALRRHIDWGVKNYFRENKKKINKLCSYDEIVEIGHERNPDSLKVSAWDTRIDDLMDYEKMIPVEERKKDDELLEQILFTPIIKLIDQMSNHSSSDDAKWHKSFFTFYTTKGVRKNGDNDDFFEQRKEVAIAHNDELFPVLEKKLLKKLLVGKILNMIHVAENALQHDDILDNYDRTLSEYHGLKEGGAKYHLKKYKKLKEAVFGDTKGKFYTTYPFETKKNKENDLLKTH